MTKYTCLRFYKTRVIAEDILAHMMDLAAKKDYVTVNEYFEISGFDDVAKEGDKWCWRYDKLDGAEILKAHNGWFINLGDPIRIEKSGWDHWYTHKPKSHCGKYPFGYDPNTEPAILINHVAESIQNYIKYGNLNNLKAARDILITAIIKLEDEESEEN